MSRSVGIDIGLLSEIGGNAPDRLWAVCESGHRWIMSLRRFAVLLMPEELAATFVPVVPDQVANLAGFQSPAIMVWELTPENYLSRCQDIQKLSRRFPHVMQIVVSEALYASQRVAVTEFGVTTSIDRPEQIYKLAGLVQRYFCPVIS